MIGVARWEALPLSSLQWGWSSTDFLTEMPIDIHSPRVFRDTEVSVDIPRNVGKMISVDIFEYLHGQQPFENVLEDVLEDVFGLAPQAPD